MSNEIKEILDNLRIYAGREENRFISDIEDYIINLQQENEILKKLKDRYQLQKECYKLKIFDAIHLINHNDIYDYRVFEKMLLEILEGDVNE